MKIVNTIRNQGLRTYKLIKARKTIPTRDLSPPELGPELEPDPELFTQPPLKTISAEKLCQLPTHRPPIPLG
jgi:hypothetical protein